VSWGGTVMRAAALLSLPLIDVLLITNAALAVLKRAAPQPNVLAVGFPVALMIGFVSLLLALPRVVPSLEYSFIQGLESMLHFATPLQPTR